MYHLSKNNACYENTASTSALTLHTASKRWGPSAPLYRQERSPDFGVHADPPPGKPSHPSCPCPAGLQTQWGLPFASAPLVVSMEQLPGRLGPRAVEEGWAYVLLESGGVSPFALGQGALTWGQQVEDLALP